MLQKVRDKYFRNDLLFVKFFISILFVSTITALVISVSMFYWFRGRTINDINKLNNTTLLNLNDTFSNYISFGEKYAIGFYYDPSIKAIVLSGEKDWNNNIFNAQGQIKSIINTNNFINSVFIFNKSDVLLNVNRKPASDESIEELFSMIKTKNVMKEPVIWVMNGSTDDKINTMTVAFQDGINNKDIDGAVAVNLDLDELQNELMSRNINNEQKFFIIDKHGKVIIATNENLINKNILSTSFIEKVISSGKDQGNFIETTNGVSYSISFTKAKQSGYYAISQIEYKQSLSGLINARNIILIVGIMLLIIISIVSAVIANKVYRPIGRLFFNIKNVFGESHNENDKLDEIGVMSLVIGNVVEKLNSLEKGNKDSSIAKMIIYDNKYYDAETLDAVKKLLFRGSKCESYCIAVIKINNFKELTENNSTDALSLQISSISTLVYQVFEDIINYNICTISNGYIIIIISEIEGKPKLQDIPLFDLITKFKKTIKTALNITITIGISDISPDIQNIKKYYMEALALTKYSIVYENGLVIDTNMSEKLNKNEISEDIVANIVNIVKMGSLDNFNSYLDNLFNESKSYYCHSIIKIFSQLISSIVKIQYGFMKEGCYSQYINNFNSYKIVSEIEDYSELRKFVSNLYIGTSEAINDINSKKIQDMLSNIVDYIKNNYNDSQLSISYISNKNSISSSYFSKIFNEYSGCSLPEYINNIKLENAKGMLLNNVNVEISEISAKVGYSSNTYFTTSFKKKYGITPSKFRLNNAIKNESDIKKEYK